MNPNKVPQETINQIYGQLNGVGAPDQLGKGYTYQNGIMGQLEVPNEHAARDLRSTPLHYTAEVVEKDDRLGWEIKTITRPGFEGNKLSW